jgi:tetratricopeptide (TPR) repeat protein
VTLIEGLSSAPKERKVAFATSAVALTAVGFLPLFAGPSYEFGLAVGVLCPALVAATCASEVVRLSFSPQDAFDLGIRQGLTIAGLAGVVALLHGLRVGLCDPFRELLWFALGPLAGTISGGVFGAFAGSVATLGGTRRWSRWLGVGLGLLGPLFGIATSLLRFYQSPIIFAFDPFFGFFAGTLYDTELTGVSRLLSYRVGTLGALVAAWGLSRSLPARAPKQPSATSPLPKRPLGIAAVLVGGAAALTVGAMSERLGHVQTAGSVRERLGHVAVTERCEVVYAGGISKRDAHALARECDAHVVQLERYFEAQAAPKITVFLFASADQKAKLMGARNVYIAKPWRNEIYIQASGYPHPVLGHELAHVVAGAFGQGPFDVAGPLGGWIPDPGRIEGFAEAAAPRDDEESTAAWAKAMRELGLLPPLERVFKLSFFGENASKAYTVAGAFIDWLRTEHGAAALRGWYGGQSLGELTGKDLAALEKDFHASLDRTPVSELVLTTAKARFDRPAVFGRRCPHQVDALGSRAQRALEGRDASRARRLYEEVLALDPIDYGARVGLASCLLVEGELGPALESFAALSRDEKLSELARLRALERAADVKVLSGDLHGAQSDYQAIAKRLLDEDDLRQLDVKLAVAPTMSEEDPARRAIVALLLGDPVLGTDWAVSGSELGRWSERDPKLGLADYLLGKNLFQRGRWEEGAKALDRALERQLPIARVRREALRTRLSAACALGQKGRAKQVYDEQMADKEIPEARRLFLRRFAERCGLELK